MKKAVFIIPYFGELPHYYPMWIKTAKKNSNFDFWIITDDKKATVVAENIKIISMSFVEFAKKVQQKFEFPIGLKTPRKLCDFRPSYGYIFEDEIKKYMYWGYCDIDVVLGDLEKNIPLEKGYDKLFVHGHMTLFKNNYEINRLFMKQNDFMETYQEILSDTKNRIFDESSDGLNINLIALKNDVKIYFDYNFADINPYLFLFKRSLYDYGLPNKKNLHMKSEDISKQIFYWNEGKLFRYALDENNKLIINEFRYFHFQKRNMKIGDILDSNSFLIVPNKMIPFEGKITEELIQKYTKNKLIYLQYFKLKWKNLKKKFGGVIKSVSLKK